MLPASPLQSQCLSGPATLSSARHLEPKWKEMGNCGSIISTQIAQKLLEEELGPSQLTWDLCSSAITFCFRKMNRTKPADREKLPQILSHRRISTNAFLTWKRICLCNIVPWWAYIDFFFKDENIWCNIFEKLEKQISLELNIIYHLKMLTKDQVKGKRNKNFLLQAKDWA